MRTPAPNLVCHDLKKYGKDICGFMIPCEGVGSQRRSRRAWGCPGGCWLVDAQPKEEAGRVKCQSTWGKSTLFLREVYCNRGAWVNLSTVLREPHSTCLETISSRTLASDMHMLNQSEANEASSPLTPPPWPAAPPPLFLLHGGRKSNGIRNETKVLKLHYTSNPKVTRMFWYLSKILIWHSVEYSWK